jgi:dephospho-CoA kinase
LAQLAAINPNSATASQAPLPTLPRERGRVGRGGGDNVVVLGLTGSIGMGKSTTARFFAEAGVSVHDADLAVHRLYAGEAAPIVETEFPGVTNAQGIDRDKLARRVLNDPEALRRLEGIIHPLVRREEVQFLDEAERAGAAVVVLDIPLLFETGAYRRVDAVVVVTAPAELQRARAFRRAGMTAEKFHALLAKQMPDAEKRRRADFLVDTSKGFDFARQQVHAILQAASTLPIRRNRS